MYNEESAQILYYKQYSNKGQIFGFEEMEQENYSTFRFINKNYSTILSHKLCSTDRSKHKLLNRSKISFEQ